MSPEVSPVSQCETWWHRLVTQVGVSIHKQKGATMPEYQYNYDADERLDWFLVEDESVVFDTGDPWLDRVLATSGMFSAEVLA